MSSQAPPPDLEARCLAATASVVGRGEYATVGAVASEACASYRVARLEDLGASVHSVAVLSQLLQIETMVAASADAFTATRFIACLKDFECELLQTLATSCIPPLTSRNSSSSSSSLVSAAPDSFIDFGVGPLARHPTVRARWPRTNTFDSTHAIGYIEAVEPLLELLARRPAACTGNLASASSVAAVAATCVEMSELERRIVEASGHPLSVLGVAIMPHALPATLHALRHATQAMRELEAATTRRALERVRQTEGAHGRGGGRSSGRTQSVRAVGVPDGAVAGSAPSVGPPAVRMRPPSDPKVARVLASCRRCLGTSSYAPTFSAVRTAVETLATPIAVPNASRRLTKKRARHGDGPHTADDDDMNGGAVADWSSGDNRGGGRPALDRGEALSVVAEYLMLHLGSTKWRRRKWEADATTPAAQRDGAAASEESGCSDSSPSSSSVPSDDAIDDASDDDASGDGVGGDGGSGDGVSGAAGDGSTGDASAADANAPPAVAYASNGTPRSSAAGAHAPEEDSQLRGPRRGRRRAEPAAAEPIVTSTGSSQLSSVPFAVEGARSARTAATDPNEIDIDSPDEDGGNARARLASAVGDAPGIAVHAERRRTDAVAPMPRRLAPSRMRDASRQVSVEAGLLGGAGCLPWHGRVGCVQPLDTSDTASVGRWGEALVHNFLLAILPPSHRVTWLNAADETRAPYDLTVSPHGVAAHRGGGTIFVEVKATRYADHNAFELSYNEWAFLASEPPVNYTIVRVSGVGDARGVRVTVVDNVLQAVKDGAVRLCMAV